MNDAAEPVFGGDVVFGPPVMVSESSVEVDGVQRRGLEAEVEPQNVDTRVRVEYGLGVGYGQSTGELDIGAGSGGGGEEVCGWNCRALRLGRNIITGLSRRVCLVKARVRLVGGDRVLRTQGAGAFRLPDSRGLGTGVSA